MKIIQTNKAPAAIGAYSQAVVSNGFLYMSGQLGIDPVTGQLAETVDKQMQLVLNNINEILLAAHLTKEHVIKANIYLKNIDDFQVVNQLYANYFGDHKPARAAVAVANLPKNGLIEIEIIAVLDPTK